MRKHSVNITLALAFLVATLSSCAQGIEVSSEAGGSDKVGEVFSKLSGKFAAIGSVTTTETWTRKLDDGSLVEDEPTITEGYTFSSVYGEDFFYIEANKPGYGSLGYNRFDKDEDGNLVVAALDPYTNTIDLEYAAADESGNPVAAPFEEYFANPFAESEDAFADTGSRIELVEKDEFDVAAFCNIFALGGFSTDKLDYMIIEYDENFNPTTVTASVHTTRNYLNTIGMKLDSEMTYEGRFVDLSSIEVAPYPEVVAPQEGQTALCDMLANLASSYNYTLDFELSDDGGAMISATMYLTEGGVYFDFDQDMLPEAIDNGLFEIGDEIQLFDMLEGNVHASAFPKAGSVEAIFDGYWGWSGNSFDVLEDGSYKISKSRLSAPIGDFLPDSNIASMKIETNSLAMRITEDGSLEYSYNVAGGYHANSRVRDIGNTAFPCSVEGYAEYVPWVGFEEFAARNPNMIDDRARKEISELYGEDFSILPFMETRAGWGFSREITAKMDDATGEQAVLELFMDMLMVTDSKEQSDEVYAYVMSVLSEENGYSWDERNQRYAHAAAKEGEYFYVKVQVFDNEDMTWENGGWITTYGYGSGVLVLTQYSDPHIRF